MEKQQIERLINILKKDNLSDWKKIIEKYNISTEVFKKIIMLETTSDTLAKLRSFIEKCYEYIDNQIFNKVLIEILEANLTTPRQFLNLEFYIPYVVKDRKVKFQDFKDLINCGFLDAEFFDSFLRKIFLPSRELDGPQLAKDYVNYAVNNKHPGYVLFFNDLYQANCPIYKLKVVYKEETRFWISTIDMIEQGASKEELEKMMPILENINGIEEARGKLIMNQIVAGARAEKISIIANKKFSYEQMIAVIQLMDSGMPLETVKKIANPKYTATQMYCLENLLNHNYNQNIFEFNGRQIEQLSKGIEDNVEVSLYYNKNYSAGKMYYIRLGLKENLDVSLYLDTQYSDKQIKEIYLGLNQKLDVYKYASPNFDAKQMQYLREVMYKQNNDEESYKNVQIDRLCNPNYSVDYMIIMTNIMLKHSFNDEELDFLFKEQFFSFLKNKQEILCSYIAKETFIMYTIAEALYVSGLERCKNYLLNDYNESVIHILSKGLSKRFTDEQLEFLKKYHHFSEEKTDIIIKGMEEGLSLEQISLFAQLNISTYKMLTAEALLINGYSEDIVTMYLTNKFNSYYSEIFYGWIKENLNYNQLTTLKKYLESGFNEFEVSDIAKFLMYGYDESLIESLINPYERNYKIDISDTIQNEIVSDEIYRLLLTDKHKDTL